MASRLRILHVSTEYDSLIEGGMGTMVTALIRSLDPEQFTSVVILPKSGHSPEWEFVEKREFEYCTAEIYKDAWCEIWLLDNAILGAPDIYPAPYDYAPMKRNDDFGERISDNNVMNRFMALAKEGKSFVPEENPDAMESTILSDIAPDVVHLHEYFGYKCIAAAHRLNAASVLTVHRLHNDLFFAEETAEAAAMHLVDKTVTVSEGYLSEYKQYFHGDTMAIPNGVDFDFWRVQSDVSRAQRRRELCERLGLQDAITFAFVSRLHPLHKGTDVLIEAYRRMRNPRPNLIALGPGTDFDAQPFERLVEEFPEQVHFERRMVPREEVREIFSAVDCSLIPSRDEPFGLTQLESMGVGALPIASRVGGLSDVIIDLDESDGGFGKFAERGDAQGLALAMDRMVALLAESPEEGNKLRLRATSRAREYTMAAMAKRHEALYTELTSKRRSSPPKSL